MAQSEIARGRDCKRRRATRIFRALRRVAPPAPLAPARARQTLLSASGTSRPSPPRVAPHVRMWPTACNPCHRALVAGPRNKCHQGQF
eukprot:354728-Chlamydomonas_euryale.AAC.7